MNQSFINRYRFSSYCARRRARWQRCTSSTMVACPCRCGSASSSHLVRSPCLITIVEASLLTLDFGFLSFPGGHSTFFGLLNTFVHIVMYTYYMFSAMGPQYQKYLWWKKYLTTLQMVSERFVFFGEQIYLNTSFHSPIAGSVYSNHGSRLPIALHWLRLSKSFCLVDRHARRYVLLPVQRVLQGSLQEPCCGKCTQIHLLHHLGPEMSCKCFSRHLVIIMFIWSSVQRFPRCCCCGNHLKPQNDIHKMRPQQQRFRSGLMKTKSKANVDYVIRQTNRARIRATIGYG